MREHSRKEGAPRVVLTPGPYGDCPFSSLLWRTLWKSYLFNWRTKLAKLLCLKCLGRMCFVNFSFWPEVSVARAKHSRCHDVLLARQSYLRRFPIVPRSRQSGFRASCRAHQQLRRLQHSGPRLDVLVQFANLQRRLVGVQKASRLLTYKVAAARALRLALHGRCRVGFLRRLVGALSRRGGSFPRWPLSEGGFTKQRARRGAFARVAAAVVVLSPTGWWAVGGGSAALQ